MKYRRKDGSQTKGRDDPAEISLSVWELLVLAFFADIGLIAALDFLDSLVSR